MTHASSEQRIQSALEQAVSNNVKGRGSGLLAVTSLDQARAGGPLHLTFVTGSRSASDRVLVEAETPYGLASITKTFVATLTLLYAEQGLLDLDSPVLDLIDDAGWILGSISNRTFRRNLERVTLRDLLAHRSGLADYWDDAGFYREWRKHEGKYWSHLEILERAGRLEPECGAGRCFHYADTNFVIVGLLLERKFGRKLHELLRDAIFEPLDMQCTWMFFEEPEPEGCQPVAHSYESKLDVTANRMQSADWAGGGLYSTLEDQAKFLSGLFGKGGLLTNASLQQMMRWSQSDLRRDTSYGLGIYKVTNGSNMTLIGHMGVHNAFSFLWPEAGILLTGSLNQEENDAIGGLLYPVMRIVMRDGTRSHKDGQ